MEINGRLTARKLMLHVGLAFFFVAALRSLKCFDFVWGDISFIFVF